MLSGYIIVQIASTRHVYCTCIIGWILGLPISGNNVVCCFEKL